MFRLRSDHAVFRQVTEVQLTHNAQTADMGSVTRGRPLAQSRRIPHQHPVQARILDIEITHEAGSKSLDRCCCYGAPSHAQRRQIGYYEQENSAYATS